MIVGVRIPLITDKAGNKVVLETFQSDETIRINGIIPGKESADLARSIVERLDHESEALQVIELMINGVKVTININYHPGGDGKAANTTTGLGGAYCTCCTKTKKEANDADALMSLFFDGVDPFPKDRNRDQNLQLFEKLKKKPDGSIDTIVKSEKRLGMTKQPMGTFIDWTGTCIT